MGLDINKCVCLGSDILSNKPKSKVKLFILEAEFAATPSHCSCAAPHITAAGSRVCRTCREINKFCSSSCSGIIASCSTDKALSPEIFTVYVNGMSLLY